VVKSDNITTLEPSAQVAHTYINVGTYVISIEGMIVGFNFENTNDKLKILTVSLEGVLSLTNLITQFFSLDVLTQIFQKRLRFVKPFKGTTNLSEMFKSCTTLTTINRINGWNTSNIITTIESMFNLGR
jgi:surface protein